MYALTCLCSPRVSHVKQCVTDTCARTVFNLTLFSAHVCDINPVFISLSHSLSLWSRLFQCWCRLVLNPLHFKVLPIVYYIHHMALCSARINTHIPHLLHAQCDGHRSIILLVWTKDTLHCYCTLNKIGLIQTVNTERLLKKTKGKKVRKYKRNNDRVEIILFSTFEWKMEFMSNKTHWC